MSMKTIKSEIEAFAQANANHSLWFEIYSNPNGEDGFLGAEFTSSGVTGIVQKAKKAPKPDDNYIVAYAFDKVEAAADANGKKSRKKDTKLIEKKIFPTKGITELDPEQLAALKAKAEKAAAKTGAATEVAAEPADGVVPPTEADAATDAVEA